MIRITRFYTRLAVITLASIVLSVHSFAQSSTGSPAIASPGVSSSAILQMMLGLALIVALLFAGAYLLRKLNGGRNFGHSGPLKIVGGLMLSPRERIVLIEVGDEWIVVGIVPGQIKTLHTLPKGELPVGNAGEKPFVQWLKQMSERGDEKK